jgi:membrane protease YdiL (CAAX protease family)
LSSPQNPLVPTDVQPPPSPVEPPRHPAEDPVWNFWDVLRIAVLAVVAIGLFSVLAMTIAAPPGGRRSAAAAELARDPRLVVPAQLAAYVIVMAFMVALVHSRGRGFWSAIRWNWPRVAWVGYAALGVALAITIQTASTLLPIPKSLPIEKYFTDMEGAYLMAAFGILIAPLVEEMFFRGFLYPVLARRLGMVAGVAVTAMAFALIHESQLAHAWGPLLLLFFVGLVLTGVRARTGSVGASFLIHTGYNATLFLLMFLASDGFRHLEKLAD